MRILLVVLVIAGILGYWYWTTTPNYSVGQIKDAVKAHDLTKFQKYVDTQSVASTMADDFLTGPVRQAFGGGIIGQVLMAGLRGLIKPEVAQGLNREICEYVENGDFKGSPGSSDDDTSGGHSLKGLNQRLGFTGHAFKGIQSIKTEGKVAQVGMIFHNNEYDKDMVLVAQMRDMGGYWQMTRLSNFPDFVGQILALQMQGGSRDDAGTGQLGRKPLNSTWSIDINVPSHVH